MKFVALKTGYSKEYVIYFVPIVFNRIKAFSEKLNTAVKVFCTLIIDVAI